MTSFNSNQSARTKAFALCAFAYALALFAALTVARIFRELHPILIVLLADIAATLVIYIFGRVFRNASFYDPYWSVAPLVIALYWMLGTSSDNALIVRQVIVIILVFMWGLRLTFNWARGWQGLKHEDWRYQDFRKKSGKWFWLVDLVGIELMPTMIVFMGCLSLYPALPAGENPFGTLDVIAIIVTAGAIAIETTADEQLRKFTLKKPQGVVILDKGLWAYSRHPNYLGEVIFWWGLFIFGLAAKPGYWWTIIGPVSITILFTFISIPLMEKRSLERRPGYDEHIKRVPVFLPWFPRT
jgi:steroid 5-alpha reductase family enzyme